MLCSWSCCRTAHQAVSGLAAFLKHCAWLLLACWRCCCGHACACKQPAQRKATHAVQVPLRQGDMAWCDFTQLTRCPVDFQSHVTDAYSTTNILFSSGTTVSAAGRCTAGDGPSAGQRGRSTAAPLSQALGRLAWLRPAAIRLTAALVLGQAHRWPGSVPVLQHSPDPAHVAPSQCCPCLLCTRVASVATRLHTRWVLTTACKHSVNCLCTDAGGA